MNPRIVTIQEKRLIGMKSHMLRHQMESIISLWKQFMPRKSEVSDWVNGELIAMQEYEDLGNFNKPFEIWACAEVSEINNIPEGMMSYTIPSGLYAVFLHKGMDAGATYQRIMTKWLPNSGYQIDDRPHFQIMGSKYKNGSPDSEEDFYVPIIDSLN
ncbi:GyrI-like domain-containing protein [Winogradskyella sp.]|uniref:GyrI-like domain-containing protein n=1 Tax=Winogradskyella sp. TaxID=1883156 RepID=UPI001B1C3AC7|nr:GyrI-like domain-containing protein [Winogradskyella sp.]MBO6880269.1 GyrI-like domain-containing protein [Winogradskyella sp.]